MTDKKPYKNYGDVVNDKTKMSSRVTLSSSWLGVTRHNITVSYSMELKYESFSTLDEALARYTELVGKMVGNE